MPSLCNLCSQISFLDLPPFPSSLAGYHVPFKADSELLPFLTKVITTPEKRRQRIPVGSLGLAHHLTLAALREAAKICEVCALIEQSVDRVRATLEEAKKSTSYVTFDKTGPPTWEFFLSKRGEGEDGLLAWSMSEKGLREAYLLGAIGFCVDDESPLKEHIPGRVVHRDPMHPAVLGRIRRWVNTCNEGHSNCHPGEVELPFRVLDVADPGLDSNTIRLAEPPAGTIGRYVSLSHCWGKSQPFTTTKATIAARKAGIDVSALPQSFQDAITISKKLGIRYIWIDSLCICQDDGADWERESAKMASIYMQSYLTLAASRSKDDSEGFLGPREARVHVELPVTIPHAAAEIDGSSRNLFTGIIHLFNIPLNFAARGHRYVEHTHEPLTARAWVVQERFLAPRTLHFGSSQTSFECLELFITEDGYQQTVSLFNATEPPARHMAAWGVDSDFSFRGSRRWNEILGIYSIKALSWESDKLPALGGMARLFQQRSRDEYVAGLWRSNIVEDLCWQTFGGTHSRPQKYRAPSWSWASIDGRISITEIGTWKDLVDVVDVQVQVKGENPLGEVSGGSIELLALLEEICIREQKLDPEEDIDAVNGSFLWWYRKGDEKSDEEENHGRFDIETDVKSHLKSLELSVLPLAAKFSDDDLNCFGLVVAPDKEGRYQRVGWAMMGEDDMVREWQALKEKGDLQTIILV